MQVEGDIRIGEATRWAARASARLTGYPWQMIIANAGALVTAVGLALTYLVIAELFYLDWHGALVAIVVGSVGGIWAGQSWCIAWSRRFARKAFAERGMTDPVPSRYAVEESAFVYTSGAVETRIPWRVVSDIVRAGPYWVVLSAGGSPVYLPRRFFPDAATESAFLRDMLKRMSTEAAARSAEAAKVAAV